MNGDTFSQRLFMIAQVVIALVIVIGGGAAMIFNLGNAQIVAPFITLVLGFLYGVQVPTPGQQPNNGVSSSGSISKVPSFLLMAGVAAIFYKLFHP